MKGERTPSTGVGYFQFCPKDIFSSVDKFFYQK